MSHTSAEESFAGFLLNYGYASLKLLDVGGDGSGRYAEFASRFGVDYKTLGIGSCDYDIRDSPYSWPIPSDSFDLVSSSSTFEHIPFFWETFREMTRVCKPGGHLYVNAPSQGPEHWDLDCWRFKSGSMDALARWGNVQLISGTLDSKDETWQDCIGIFKKP